MSLVRSELLRQIVDRLENLEQQKQDIQEGIKEVLAEAKGSGLDTKIIRKVLQIRKMKPNEVVEQEELVHLYLEALRGK